MTTPRTTTLSDLNAHGWYCPACGHELIRAGGPNAPEIAACTNAACGQPVITIVDEQEG